MLPGTAAVHISYPTRRRLAKRCVRTGGLAIALIAWLVYTLKTTPPFSASPPGSGFGGAYFGLLFLIIVAPLTIPPLTLWSLLVLYRLLRPGFSLAITPEGIVDNCSLFATGVGLIRWENVAAVNPVGYSRFAPDSAVLIRVRDPNALLDGRPWPVRMLRRLFVIVMPGDGTLFIFLFMIDDYRAGDLAAVIAKEYEARRVADPRLAALPPARIVV